VPRGESARTSRPASWLPSLGERHDALQNPLHAIAAVRKERTTRLKRLRDHPASGPVNTRTCDRTTGTSDFCNWFQLGAYHRSRTTPNLGLLVATDRRFAHANVVDPHVREQRCRVVLQHADRHELESGRLAVAEVAFCSGNSLRRPQTRRVVVVASPPCISSRQSHLAA